MGYEIIHLDTNKYVHFDCKTLEELDNIIPDLTLSDEQVELMYKENDSSAIEIVSCAIYDWIMVNLKTVTKIGLANQENLKDMLTTFAQITNTKSVSLCRNERNLCIKYDKIN